MEWFPTACARAVPGLFASPKAFSDSFSLPTCFAPRADCECQREIFFHSPKLETITSSASAGCHLCSIVSWDEDKYFWQKNHARTPSLEYSTGIIQVSVTAAWPSKQMLMSFEILTDLQTSPGQMENPHEMDSIINDRFRRLQGWERWKGERSLGAISLRNDDGISTTAPHSAVNAERLFAQYWYLSNG